MINIGYPPRITPPVDCTAYLDDMATFTADIDAPDATIIWQYIKIRSETQREIQNLVESAEVVGTHTRTLRIKATAARSGMEICARFTYRDTSLDFPCYVAPQTKVAILTVIEQIHISHPGHVLAYADQATQARFHVGISASGIAVQWYVDHQDGNGWLAMDEMPGCQDGTRTDTLRVHPSCARDGSEFKAVFTLPGGRTMETQPATLMILPFNEGAREIILSGEECALPYGTARFTVYHADLLRGGTIEWKYLRAGDNGSWRTVAEDEFHRGVDTHQLTILGQATRPECHLDRYCAIIRGKTQNRAAAVSAEDSFLLRIKRQVLENYFDAKIGAAEPSSREAGDSQTVRVPAGTVVRLNATERRSLNVTAFEKIEFSFDGTNWHEFQESAAGHLSLDSFKWTGSGGWFGYAKAITGIIRPPKTMWVKFSGSDNGNARAYTMKIEVSGTTTGDSVQVWGSPPGDPQNMSGTTLLVSVKAGQTIVVSGGVTAGTAMLKYEYSFDDGAAWHPFNNSASGYINVQVETDGSIGHRYTKIKGVIIPPRDMWVRVSSEYSNQNIPNHFHVMKITVEHPRTDVVVNPGMTPAKITVPKNATIAYIKSEAWGPDTMVVRWHYQVASDAANQWTALADGAGPSPNPILARLTFQGVDKNILWIKGISPATVGLKFKAVYRDPVLDISADSPACELSVSTSLSNTVPKVVSYPIVAGAMDRTRNLLDASHMVLRDEYLSFPEGGTIGDRIEIAHRMRREGVIGKDGRIQILNTQSFPYRCIGIFTSKFRDNNAEVSKAGTAWMVGRDLAITAGHNLFDPTLKQFGYDMMFYAGANGPTAPVTQSQVAQIWMDQNFCDEVISSPRAADAHSYDWALVRLKTPLGDQTGWLGLEWNPDIDFYNHARVASTGYPDEVANIKVHGTPWLSEEQVLASEAEKFQVDIDGTPGQSGAPVYFADDYVATAIFVGAWAGANFNWCKRITHQLYSLVAHLKG